MIILGLTGGIASGKSTTSGIFHGFGVPVFDADAAVHRLFAPRGEAVGPVRRAFGDEAITTAGAVDRAHLSAMIVQCPSELKKLEAIVHPLMRLGKKRFLEQCHRRRCHFGLLDIPLLFETGGQRDCDVTITMSLSKGLQRQRALARPGMTEEKLSVILSRQVTNQERVRQADHVITSALGKRPVVAAVRNILQTYS